MGFSNDVRITSLDVARALGFREEKKSGGNWRNFCCPFCGDTKFRLGCNIEKGGYKCFHCGAKGTPLSLYARATQGISVESLNDEKTHELIKEMTARCVNGSVPTETEKQRYQHKEIPVAPSSVLDRTYSTLLSLPWLKLTKEHLANLKKRGLTDADIQRNGYASFTVKVSEQMAVSAKNASKRFNAIKGELFSYSRMKQKTSASVIAGMVIASALLKRGCELQGVPGFYKVQNTWILNLPEGMLIPTRNSGGQVVGIQVRRDGDTNPRYLTVSANRLPCGVTTGISRAHFPLGNAPLTKGTTVYLTEGPLKADVALALLEDKNAAFIAIQGVTNTKMLDEVVFPSLKERGITRVTNALDMDKLTNPGVIMACSALKQLAQKHGIRMEMLCWDAEYAAEKEQELAALCEQHGLGLPPEQNVFKRIGAMALALHKKGIRHSVSILPNGKAKKAYWDDAEKGIDDHLLGERKRKAKMGTQAEKGA